jgi:formylglycine-generating enzyme required for sulfatase activity
MNSIAIRELARIQSLLHVLKTQRDTLSELSDIQAFRGLEESYRDDLEEAQKRGLVASDPVADVRSDWLRLVSWSNRIQLALRAADNLGNDLDTLGPKPDKESGKKKKKMEEEWLPSLSDLQQLKMALEGAPRVLVDAIERGCRELQPGDWSSGRPYGELAEVADAMEWTEKLELAESPGPWAHGIGLRDRHLVASRLAVEGSSPMVERRQRSLKDRLAHVVELIERHSKHAATLDDVGRLTDAGQVETARRLIGTLQATFGDLDYSAREQQLAQLEKQLKSQSEKIAETKKELQELGREAGGFFAFPPIGLMRRGSVAQGTAEKVTAETAQIGKVGGNSEVDRMVSGWTTGLKSDLDSLQTLWMSRVRRWILGTTVFWLLFLVAGGVTFQQVRAGQERERQRVVAEAKAAEERTLAEARVKAETEERERQRLVAEAKVKVEAAETAFASKLGLSKPFVAGARGQAGDFAVRWVPSGRFTLGSPLIEPGRDSDEVQYEVVLTRGFFLGETECTQGQWEKVMGGNPSHFRGSERPVEQVSWEEAVEYCRKLTAKQRVDGILPFGWEWRLPTEAEWEYAARAGTTGARYGELDAIAWWSGNSGNQTHPASQKAANAWGLHDMMGNVWEWCSDWSGDYLTGSVTNPTGPSSGSFRVDRGGSWYNGAGNARSAYRSRDVPGFRSRFLGFRPVLSSVR